MRLADSKKTKVIGISILYILISIISSCTTNVNSNKDIIEDIMKDSIYYRFNKELDSSQEEIEPHTTIYAFEYNFLDEILEKSLNDKNSKLYNIKVDKIRLNPIIKGKPTIKSAVRTSIMFLGETAQDCRVVEFWHLNIPLPDELQLLKQEGADMGAIFIDSCNELSRIAINDSSVILIRRATCRDKVKENINIDSILMNVGINEYIYW